MIVELYGRKWQLVTEQRLLVTPGTSPSFAFQSDEPIIFLTGRAVLVTSVAVGTRLVKFFYNGPLTGPFQIPCPTGVAPNSSVIVTWNQRADYASPDPAYQLAMLPDAPMENCSNFGIAIDNLDVADQLSSVYFTYLQRLVTE